MMGNGRGRGIPATMHSAYLFIYWMCTAPHLIHMILLKHRKKTSQHYLYWHKSENIIFIAQKEKTGEGGPPIKLEDTQRATS